MKLWLAALIIASSTLWAQTRSIDQSSSELLFVKSDSAAALRESAEALARNPKDLSARFVRMESARVQLQSNEALASAIALLQSIASEDARGRVAAERIRELASNTPVFCSAVPKIAELLARNNLYSRELSAAMLIASADGVHPPKKLKLTRRVTSWQLAGPFGKFSNVDFDRSWPPERDQLRSTRYGQNIREVVESESGVLELPEYFPRTGIYYAAAALPVTSSGKFRLTVESAGTFELFVDGKDLVRHDARFRQQSNLSQADLALTSGDHRLVLKLQTSATPIRIWIEPIDRRAAAPITVSSSEQRYLLAATSLLDGSPSPALALDESASSAAQLLRAEALSQIGEEQQARNALGNAATSDANNFLAEFRIAQQAFVAERYEEAAKQIGKVLRVSVAYAPAQELKYELAEHFDWTRERNEALAERIRLHPNCSTFLDAANFEDSQDHNQGETQYESKLATCSSAPYQYWERLSRRGQHDPALGKIGGYLEKHPLDRRAATAAIREAVLAGNKLKAQQYAHFLATLAPNSIWVKTIEGRPESILDSRSGHAPVTDFYQRWARDARSVMANVNVEDRPLENRVLFNDRVVKLERTGGAWVYQHTVTQVFDKKGIERAGEVPLPHSIDLLELRTLKQDGSIVEPEVSDNKSSVSMPSLTEGDAIEIAYLEHFPAEILVASPELLDFTFTSPDFPTRSAHLTIINEGAPQPALLLSPDVTRLTTEPAGTTEITQFAVSNIGTPLQEPASLRYDPRPHLSWLSIDSAQLPNSADRYRDELIQASQITPRIEQLALHLEGLSKREALAAAYQQVIATVEEGPGTWRQGTVASGDESLEQGEGSRTAALIALVSAMGFDVDLLLAAERGTYDPTENCSASRCYKHPLVRVTLSDGGAQILLDPQISGLSVGALSPEVEGEPALVISRNRSLPGQEVVSIPQTSDERSTATADLRFEENGEMQGNIHIRFGSFRGAQMRETLRQRSAKDRQGFFEQIAARILPNPTEVFGSLAHEQDAEQPLELDLAVRTPKFGRWDGSEMELGQIVPALGLSRMYATLPERHGNLLLEIPLVESSEFFVHLPDTVEVLHLPESADLHTSFGDYRTDFRVESGVLRIVRSFQIPMQIIGPADYAAFSNFALKIDSAERKLIQLRRSSVSRNIQDGVPPLAPFN